jgi:hypothetical protein
VEWDAGVHREIGPVRVDADASAVVAMAGDVRQTSASVRVAQDASSLEVAAGATAQRGHAAGRAWGRVELVTDPVSVSLGGAMSARNGVVQTVSVDARVDTKNVAVSTTGLLSRHGDAPLALEEAEVEVSGQLRPGVSLGAGVKLVPDGLDGVSAQVAAVGDAGSIAVTASGAHLTTSPTVGLAVTATEKKSGVAVTAHAEATPSTGEVEGGVSVSVPLPK